MEVHAHTHTERKKFTHYLWEFLMLFLAVFCGFLAENWREHNVEKAREKQYIISLLEDWKEDTAMFDEIVSVYAPIAIARADSIIQFLNSKDPSQYAKELYILIPRIQRRFLHSFQDRTIVQLRNAGGLRLITNSKVKDSISLYYERVAVLQSFDETIGSVIRNSREMWYKLFYIEEYRKLFDPNTDNLVGTKDPLHLRPVDPADISEFSFLLQHYRSNETQFLKRTRTLNNRMAGMISFIKKEYNLE